MTTTTIVLAAIIGYCLGPVLLVATIYVCDAWREWRWKRAAPARAAAQKERERRSRELIDQMNADAAARGSGERYVMAGLDCLMITYTGRDNRLRR